MTMVEGAARVDSSGLWSFLPDGRRAAALNAEINRRLLDSLRYVFGEVGSQLGGDPAAFEHWVTSLEGAERIDPLIHTLFHTLVAEIEAGDGEAVAATLARLTTLGTAPTGPAIHAVEDEESSSRPVALFSRFADLEEANRLDLRAPTADQIAAGERMVGEALDLIRRNDPALAAELRAFVTDILLVDQEPGHLFTAAAVSCFQNWGGLLFNPSVHDNALNVIEMLAHEATHLQLFAVAMDEPLLTNPPEQRVYSPLREAPRSMDGVFHATIVAARVVRAMLAQAEAVGTDADDRSAALQRIERNVGLFEEGVAIVEENGLLTPLGRRVLDDSKAYIAERRAELFVTA